MTKLASLTGYTTGSAAFTMSKIRRKLKARTAGISAASPTPKKASGRPRTNKNADEEVGTPSKRAKKGAVAEQDDDEEDFAPAIKKEEVSELNQGANVYFGQLQNAAKGYGFQENGDEDE
jgi:hypothetical protein